MRVRKILALPAAFLAVGVLACDSSLTGPGPSGDAGSSQTSFSRSISSSELGSELASGARRVEIKLADGQLVARELELERRDEMTDDEKIESRVESVQASGGTGTLTLDVGQLQIEFDGGVDLEGRDGRDLTVQAFADSLDAVLASGRQPFVEVKRRAPAEPQAPGDATFAPREIQLQAPDDDREIEINVDADNFEENGSPPPQAWITVLGLRIEIRDGTTRIEERRDPDEEGDQDFEGRVTSADVGAGSVTLADGTVIRVVTGTEVDGAGEDDADEDELVSVQEVADALDAGRFVVADGEGVVESTDPRTITAVEVEFEVDDDRDADDDGVDDDACDDADAPAGCFEFEDSVTAVDVGARTFTLAGGDQVRLDDETTIEADGDLHSLEAVADAVDAGRPVRAEGDAVEESDGTWRALSVKFEVDD